MRALLLLFLLASCGKTTYSVQPNRYFSFSTRGHIVYGYQVAAGAENGYTYLSGRVHISDIGPDDSVTFQTLPGIAIITKVCTIALKGSGAEPRK